MNANMNEKQHKHLIDLRFGVPASSLSADGDFNTAGDLTAVGDAAVVAGREDAVSAVAKVTPKDLEISA